MSEIPAQNMSWMLFFWHPILEIAACF